MSGNEAALIGPLIRTQMRQHWWALIVGYTGCPRGPQAGQTWLRARPVWNRSARGAPVGSCSRQSPQTVWSSRREERATQKHFLPEAPLHSRTTLLTTLQPIVCSNLPFTVPPLSSFNPASQRCLSPPPSSESKHSCRLPGNWAPGCYPCASHWGSQQPRCQAAFPSRNGDLASGVCRALS